LLCPLYLSLAVPRGRRREGTHEAQYENACDDKRSTYRPILWTLIVAGGVLSSSGCVCPAKSSPCRSSPEQETSLSPGVHDRMGYSDRIRGGGGRDLIGGKRGDDVIRGGRGQDEIHGGRGNDLIRGGHGNDTLFGHSGNDEIFGDRGDDSIFGGSGFDICVSPTHAPGCNG
jgi:hypothetical protein